MRPIKQIFKIQKYDVDFKYWQTLAIVEANSRDQALLLASKHLSVRKAEKVRVEKIKRFPIHNLARSHNENRYLFY